MKQLLCVLLVLWFGVMSNWAQAHATHEAAHEIAHAVEDVVQHATPDAEHEDHCGLAHCCHSLAVPSRDAEHVYLGTIAARPAMTANFTPRLPPPDIERPKWALATHAVAGF